MARVAEADDLYGLPLGEFVAARTALAKRLRSEGRADDAAWVGGLRKPSVALWAVNQAARYDPGEVRALLRAADRLRRGDGEETGAELRSAVQALVETASRRLEERGHAVADATVQRVATTLRAAAAAGDEERDALARGALPQELEPAGFEAMAALAGSPGGRQGAAAPRRAADREDEKRRARVAAAERALAEARARERELSRDAEAAEREAERTRRAAERATADVEKAERALERARARLTD